MSTPTATYRVYVRKKKYNPSAASNAELYWLVYEGLLDEIEMPYPGRRGTFPMPDTTDQCLWRNGTAILSISRGSYIINVGRKKRSYWKYSIASLCLENGFDATGVRRKPVRKGSLPLIPGDYQKCVHSTKRQQPSWRVLPSCPHPTSIRMGNRHHLPHTEVCETCPDYRYDRSLAGAALEKVNFERIRRQIR